MSGNFSGGSFSGAVGGFSVDVVPTSGGFAYDYGHVHRRTPDELRRERKRFGITTQAAQIIHDVALQQAEDLRLNEKQKLEALRAAMRLRGLEMQNRHLEALNAERARLLDNEIENRLHLMLENHNATLLLMLVATVH